MIWLYLLLLLTGFVLFVRLASRRSRQAWTALAGAVLAIFSIIAGFSIGIYIAPVALLLLAFSARGLGSHGKHVE